MAKIVAIISEYNPFHKGHKYQIDKIKEEIKDPIIIAIMSGNIVQRGEFAFIDKYTRAKMAIECGVDAVFELPFPYACATAEIFANAGVEIASKLGAEYLYFGLENDSLEKIEETAKAINSDEFKNQIKLASCDKHVSYPVLKEKILEKMGIKLSKYSNDMLAIEYIRAIQSKNLSLEYRAIKRIGAKYKDNDISDIMSASAIRNNFYINNEILSIPKNAEIILKEDIQEGKINDKNFTNRFLLSSLLLLSQESIENTFDTPNGMGNFILEYAKKCKKSNCFTDEISTKNYTTARLKRAIIYSIFNVTEIDKSLDFTVLLGANENGKKIINKIRKLDKITILTKHSDTKKLNEKSIKIYEKGLKVDEIFYTLCKEPQSADLAYKKIPYIK